MTEQLRHSPMQPGAASFFQSLFDISFSSFITLKVLKVLYVIQIVAAAIFTVSIWFAGFKINVFVGILFLFIAPVIGLVLIMLGRLGLETIAVLFSMQQDIAVIARGKGTPLAAPSQAPMYEAQPSAPEPPKTSAPEPEPSASTQTFTPPPPPPPPADEA